MAPLVGFLEAAFRRLDLDSEGRPQVASIDRLLDLAGIEEPEDRELGESLLREIFAGHRRGVGEHYEDEAEKRKRD